MRFEALSTDVIRARRRPGSGRVGRELSNTFNQGTDGELIECVEKSGFCDNILFSTQPPQPMASPARTPSANASPAFFQRCFSRKLRAPETRVGVWGGGCCLLGPAPQAPSFLRLPQVELGSPLQAEPEEARGLMGQAPKTVPRRLLGYYELPAPAHVQGAH